MNDYSLVEKIGVLMSLVSSSPLFLIALIIGLILLIFFIVCTLLNKNINKSIFIVSFVVIGFMLVINYFKVIVEIIDTIIDAAFKALYFPSLPIYAAVVVISNIILITTLFDKDQRKSKKILNVVTTVILDFLLVLVIDIVSKNNINIYEEINLYTNSNLLVLLELSMGVFTSWILLSLFVSANEKLKKYDKKESMEIPEIIFDEF